MIQRYCINYGELSKADFDGGLVMYEDHVVEINEKVEELEDLCRDMADFMATSIDCLSQYDISKGVAEIMIKRVNEKKLCQRLEALNINDKEASK